MGQVRPPLISAVYSQIVRRSVLTIHRASIRTVRRNHDTHGTMDAESKPLTEAELRFVDEYIIDHNATQAYFRAYGKTTDDGRKRTYSQASSNAHNLLKRLDIRQEIRAAEHYICRRNRVTADRVVKELAAIAFSSMGDVFDFAVPGRFPEPKETRDIPAKAIQALEKAKLEEREIPQEDGEPIRVKTIEYKFHSKLSALEKLYDHLGMGRENEVERLLSILPEDLRARVTVEIERAAATRSLAEGGTEGGGRDRPIRLAGRAD